MPEIYFPWLCSFYMNSVKNVEMLKNKNFQFDLKVVFSSHGAGNSP